MTPLYQKTDPSLSGLPTNYVAIDTETTLFDWPKFSPDGKTRLSPFLPGKLILGSIAAKGEVWVYYKKELVRQIHRILDDEDFHFIFHNVSYDVFTLINYDPTLKSKFCRAVRENRVHDTRILETLCRIASGQYHSGTLGKETHLANLARQYAGMELEKGQERVTFSQFLVFPPDSTKDRAHLEYAANDAIATYRVYAALVRKAEQYINPPDCAYPILPSAVEKFGPLSERNQVMGALGLDWFQQFPLVVDSDKVTQALEASTKTITRLQDAMADWAVELPKLYKRKSGNVLKMVPTPWGKYNKKGEFKLSHKALQAVLEVYAADNDISVERTPTGQVTLDYEFWREHIPPLPPGIHPSTADNLLEQLGVWMAYTKLRMAHSRYLVPLSHSDKHYPSYYNIGALTGRTSASKFPVHQVPKRSNSLRGLFVAEPNKRIIEADFKAAELSALAQIYHLRYGGSVLGDAINDGFDPHMSLARRIWPEFHDKPTARQKELRQACKAINFGAPGGLGAKTLSGFARGYGVYLSIDAAKELREMVLQADPQLSSWLGPNGTPQRELRIAARNLNMTYNQLITVLGAWRIQDEGIPHLGLALSRLKKWCQKRPETSEYNIPVRPGFKRERDTFLETTRSVTGLVRGGVGFCNARNTPFQSTISCVLKVSLFNLWDSWNPDSPWQPFSTVHDSIALQVEDKPIYHEVAAIVLKRSMTSALREILPDVPGAGVDVGAPSKSWGENTGIYVGI
jgi:DNA polymerase I-like protein with 3'-5' exonuclease and polymerase domains